MKLRTMMLAAGVTLGSMSPIAVAASQPVSADPAPVAATSGAAADVEAAAKTCSDNYVCMWEDASYNGSRYVRQYKTSGYYQIDNWDGDNEISSVKNNTGKCVRLYANDDHTGNDYTVRKEVKAISDLKQVGFNDDAESYRIFSC